MAARIFDKLAAVFNDDVPTESTLADVSLLESSLQALCAPSSSTSLPEDGIDEEGAAVGSSTSFP